MWMVQKSPVSGPHSTDSGNQAASRTSWMLWLVPLGLWAVYLCWLTGYRNGYESGHDDGWNTARKTINNGATQLVEMRRQH